MSSVIRHIAQIPVRTKYLLAVVNGIATDDAADSPAFSLSLNWPFFDNVPVLASDVNSNATALGLTAGALYRDLGRQIVIADNVVGAPHLAVYRQVQLVDGSDSEGVGGVSPSYGCLFVRVWGADGMNVVVARTG